MRSTRATSATQLLWLASEEARYVTGAALTINADNAIR
jgi:hypothetical protein